MPCAAAPPFLCRRRAPAHAPAPTTSAMLYMCSPAPWQPLTYEDIEAVDPDFFKNLK